MRLPKACLVYAAILLIADTCFADAAPKPSMKFRMVYHTSRPVRVIEGWQLESETESFTVSDTVISMGNRGFIARQQTSRSVAGSYRDFQKVIIRFDDRVRESRVFRNESFNSEYELTVYDDRLEVKDVTNFISNSASWALFIKALIFTLLIEVLVAIVFVILWHIPGRTLLFVALGSVLTLPLVWFVFPLFLKAWTIPAGEAAAFLLEALFLMVTCKPALSAGRAFTLSLVINLASFVIGGLFLVILTVF